VTSRSFVLLVADQRFGEADARGRLGITVSRRVGSAVVRARVKRRVREWFRRRPGEEVFPSGMDLVVIARARAASATQEEISTELEDALRRIAKGTRSK
jgi:ribonuclease P protein component